MVKTKPTLPREKFAELPAQVVKDQIMAIFKEEVRNSYDIDIIIKDGDRWFIKMVLNPEVAFKYRKKEASDEDID